MDFEYSPHRSAGGTMHLLSPSHTQCGVDAFPSIKQLRRSLSRSPSKPSRFQIHSNKSPKKAPSSPRSPSVLSRAFSANAADFSIKSKFTLRRTAPIKATPRKLSPTRHSPMRRALSDGISQGNATSPGLLRRASNQGQENALRPNQNFAPDMRFELDNEPIKFDLLKVRGEKPSSISSAMRDHLTPVKSSPLKRSDGVMNLDQVNLGSPRAKRRSLCGVPFGPDFDIFDQGFDGANNDAFDDEGKDHQESASPAPPKSPQRRPFSLRRSTLSQRPGGGSARPRLSIDTIEPAPQSPAPQRSGMQMSLVSVLPLRGIEANVELFAPPAQRASQSAPKPHPLSKALSPSSSNSSIGEDAVPFLPPPHHPATRPHAGFSKSLPIGAIRPKPRNESDPDSFETPEAYKMARPLPAAFMSTGLISKRNRNAELNPAQFGSSLNMPDTPSKKYSMPAATPAPASGLGKFTHPRHEFGSPTTPWSPHTIKGSPESFGKGVSIFGSRVGGKLARRSSFLSIDGDDCSQSPTGQLDTQASNDDLPPTPTKPAHTGPRSQGKAKGNSLRSSLFGRRTSLAPDTFVAPAAESVQTQQPADHTFASITSSTGDGESKTEASANDSMAPFITFTGCDEASAPSFARSRMFRETTGRRSPSPLSIRSLNASTDRTTPAPDDAESDMQEATTPTTCTRPFNDVPLTPVDSFTPPDPSYLSISAPPRGSFTFDGTANSYPPATPTGPRDCPFNFGVSQGAAASVSGYFGNDVDTTLTARFGTVHVYGTGEFSMVYRVEKALAGGPAAHLQSPRSVGNVWAVKKTKKPYSGSKDRARKMREVQILKALRGTEHVIELIDTWEMKNHLYIQTEFCENGNLKDFLSQTGYKARLDDFRIWKILLELCQGVQCIHNAGYIHLDLKPANVFIDWEGVLKIGDFGMASAWPAPPHLDGEGDREYIAPEVLCGRFDKPADIFALGMIMLEIAGNIVLPDNGSSWQRLRSGDMSDLPSLTFSSESTLVRDESGDPVAMLLGDNSTDAICASDDEDDDLGFVPRRAADPSRAQELVSPPNFMVDSDDDQALDKLVQWMISPDPDQRPTIDQLLSCGGVQWVERRRRAGASIYEGNWGPVDDVVQSAQDVEMLDI